MPAFGDTPVEIYPHWPAVLCLLLGFVLGFATALACRAAGRR